MAQGQGYGCELYGGGAEDLTANTFFVLRCFAIGETSKHAQPVHVPPRLLDNSTNRAQSLFIIAIFGTTPTFDFSLRLYRVGNAFKVFCIS